MEKEVGVRKFLLLMLPVILLLSSCNSGRIDLRKMKHSLDVKVSNYFDALTNKNKVKMYMLEPKWRRNKILFDSYNPPFYQERINGKFVSAFVRDIKYDLLHNKAIVTVRFMKEVKEKPGAPVLLKPVFIEKQLWVYKNGEWGYEKTLKRINLLSH